MIGRILLLLFFVSLFYGCKKKTTEINNNVETYDFSYTGSLKMYDTVFFSCTAPTASTFLWQFGDGSSSADPNPAHVYTTINCDNSYKILYDTVRLTINNDTAHRLVKLLRITPNTQLLLRTGNWTHGMHQPNGLSVTGDTAHSLNDTAFVINLINDSTINVWNEDLPYNAAMNSYVNLWGYPGHFGSILTYRNDTIFFANSHGGNGHWDVDSYYK